MTVADVSTEGSKPEVGVIALVVVGGLFIVAMAVGLFLLLR